VPNIKPEVQRLIDAGLPISYDTYASMRMNTYERLAIYPLLDNDALVRITQHCLNNCSISHGTPVTYDETLVRVLAPLLIERLQEKHKESCTDAKCLCKLPPDSNVVRVWF
jgi:hypothetical protein